MWRYNKLSNLNTYQLKRILYLIQFQALGIKINILCIFNNRIIHTFLRIRPIL